MLLVDHDDIALMMRLFDAGIIWTEDLAWRAVRRAVGLPYGGCNDLD
jgi:hypothetical protein